MSRRITKVKYKKGHVEIHLEDHAQTVDKETVVKSTEKPHPDFELAFSALVGFVYDILELDRGCWGPMIVTGVSFSQAEDSGVEGAVLTFQVELDESNSPFCGNTPHLPFDQYSETGTSPVMPEDCVAQLEKVRKEAFSYMEGKKAQGELLLANAPDGKAAAAGPES